MLFDIMDANLLESPIEEAPIGEMGWMQQESGWSQFKISRLCRLGLIPGAFQAQRGTQGSKWMFRKSKTLKWLRSLENK
jgi:hypothetical protein